MQIQRAPWLLLFTLYSSIYGALAFHDEILHSKDFVFSANWKENGQGCGDAIRTNTSTIGSFFTTNFTGNAVYLGVTTARDRGLISITINETDFGNFSTWLETSDPKILGCADVGNINGLPLGAHRFKATLVDSHIAAVFEVFQLRFSAPDEADIPPPPAPTTSSSSQSASLVPTPSSSQPSRDPLPSSTSATRSISSSRPATPMVTSMTSTSSYTSPSSPVKTAEVTPDDPRIQYFPADAWQAREETLCGGQRINTRVTSRLGATLTFTFRGSSIYLKSLDKSTSPYSVSVDGNGQWKSNSPSNNSCTDYDSGYARMGLGDSDHTITISLANNTAILSRRADAEFVFAGFQYTGAEAIDTASLLPPPTPSNSPPSAAVIGGAVGGALAGILIVCLAGIFGYRRWKAWRARRHLAPSTIYMESHSHVPRTGARGSSPTWGDNESIKGSIPESTAYENLIAGPPSARSPSFRWRTKTLASLSTWRTGRAFPRPSVSSPSSATHIPDPMPNSIY